MNSKLKRAVEFHGHLGPYLVLGLLAGELALKKLGSPKYFGLEVKVWGATEKPKSCLVDGLQLSTGATYGKGNIRKLRGRNIKIEVKGKNCGKLTLGLRKNILLELSRNLTHRESESLADKFYRLNPVALFTHNT